MKDPVRLELENGAVLLLHHNHANTAIAFRGSIRAGSGHGPPGVAEFAARLLLRGTRKKSPAKVAETIENLGAAITCDNGEEAAYVTGRCTRETIPTTLSVLLESLSEPAFSASETEKVRGEILGDIRADQDDTRHAAMRRWFQLVYPKEHPYHRDPKGDEASVKRVRSRDLKAFHGKRYGASGIVFGFSGDLDVETFEGTVAAAFENLEPGAPATPFKPARPGTPGHGIVGMPHKSQADLVVGRLAIPRSHPDYQVVNLANNLFGRIGLYGRLGERVRDTLGLAYYSFSTLEARRSTGHWYIGAGVNPKNLVAAAGAIREEMVRLETEPFSEEEIRDGKENLVGGLQVNLERNAEYAAALHDIEYYNLGTDYLERYPRIVRSLDPDRVRTEALRYFAPDGCTWAASGPVAGIRLSF